VWLEERLVRLEFDWWRMVFVENEGKTRKRID